MSAYFLTAALFIMLLLTIPLSPLKAEEGLSPVAVVRIADTVLTKLIDRDIVQDSPVNDDFEGTIITGCAHTYGRPNIVLPDTKDAATFDVLFNGTTNSRTIGHHPPVAIYGHSCTAFSARKQIVFTPGKGFYALPATINSNTQVVTDNIVTNRRGIIGRAIVRRAWAEVEASKAEATAFAKENAQERIVQAFDGALEERLAQLNQAVNIRYIAESLFQVELPPNYQCSTKQGYLELAITTQRDKHCDLNLPKLPENPAPIQLWLHKSLLGFGSSIQLPSPDVLINEIRHLLIEPFPILASIASSVENLRTPSKVESISASTVDDWLVIQFKGDRIGISAPFRSPSRPSGPPRIIHPKSPSG